MSETARSPRGGDFATSRRGGITEHEVAFIKQKLKAGFSAQAISKMVGRSMDEVTAWADFRTRTLRPSMAQQPPPPTPAPSKYVLSLWKGLIVRPVSEFRLTMDQVAQEVCDRRGVSMDDLRGVSRSKHIAEARQEAMWRMCKTEHWSTPQIGRFFDRDHSTVIHARDKYEALYALPVGENVKDAAA